MKVGDLARRSGVDGELLRAWERRYGLLHPRRTSGNHRLYSTADLHRVLLMQRHLAAGHKAAHAAELTNAARLGVPPGRRPAVDPDEVRRAHAALREALEDYRESAAQRVLEPLLAAYDRLAVLRDVVLPYLRDVGDRWQTGHLTVPQEHFASRFFEARMSALARGWDHGVGPRALLACPAGERHTFGLVSLGIALHDHGWRIVDLGADTPVDLIADAAERVAPDLVVLAAAHPDRLAPHDAVRDLAGRWPCAVGGAGVDAELAARLGARHLAQDPITAAHDLAR